MSTAVVLCLPLRDLGGVPHVLLGRKKTGFGRTKTVAPGGKIERGESPAQAAARELAEETALAVEPGELHDAGHVAFRFPSHPAWDMDCTVFLAPTASGEAVESDELEPRWYPVGRLPVESMWQDSVRWLPPMLAGQRLDVTVVLADDNESVTAYRAEPRAPAGDGVRLPGTND